MFLNFRKNSEKFPVLQSFFNKVVKSDSTSETSSEQSLQRVTNNFSQRATSATSNKRISQDVTSDFCDEQLLQRVPSKFYNEELVTLCKE